MLKASHAYEPLEGSGISKRTKVKAVAGFLILGLAAVVLVASLSPAAPPSDEGAASAPTKNAPACPLPRGVSELTIKSRSVQMFVPDTIATGPLPLILMFHGIASSPDDVEVKARLREQDGGRFLIAYPWGSGVPRGFNGAGCCKDNRTPDDVAFAKEVVTELEALGCASKYNAFATGFSNGGFMSHKIGCEAGYRPDNEPWFRAIAPHSGLLGSYDSTPYTCPGTQKIPVLSFHGSTDGTVPIKGGKSPNPLSKAIWQSFDSTRDTWATKNGCTNPTAIQRAPSTSCTTYTCPAGTSVEFCTATGLAHQWMGHQNPTEDYDATSAIFDFFTEYLRR